MVKGRLLLIYFLNFLTLGAVAQKISFFAKDYSSYVLSRELLLRGKF